MCAEIHECIVYVQIYEPLYTHRYVWTCRICNIYQMYRYVHILYIYIHNMFMYVYTHMHIVQGRYRVAKTRRIP